MRITPTTRILERCPECTRDIELEVTDLKLIAHPTIGSKPKPSAYRWQCPRCLTKYAVVVSSAVLRLLEAAGTDIGPDDPTNPAEVVLIRINTEEVFPA